MLVADSVNSHKRHKKHKIAMARILCGGFFGIATRGTEAQNSKGTDSLWRILWIATRGTEAQNSKGTDSLWRILWNSHKRHKKHKIAMARILCGGFFGIATKGTKSTK
jgi:hypothetical protein